MNVSAPILCFTQLRNYSVGESAAALQPYLSQSAVEQHALKQQACNLFLPIGGLVSGHTTQTHHHVQGQTIWFDNDHNSTDSPLLSQLHLTHA